MAWTSSAASASWSGSGKRDADVLTKGTGGASFSFARQAGLESAIARLGEELHSQYVLSFTPTDAEPGYHRIEVQIVNQPKAQIRARPGYWATKVD